MGSLESLLADIPLFSSLPNEEKSRLVLTLRVTEVPAATVLFREGERSGHFYIVLEGSVEIIKAVGTAEESVLGVRRQGEFIGEMGLLNPDGLRTATARSLGMTRLLEIPFTEFTSLLARHPTLAYRMASALSTRMTAAQDDTIHTLYEKNLELRKSYAALQAAQVQLVEKEKLERELELAREIQRSILPTSLPQLAGYEFGALMVPVRFVGGDFFSLFPLDEDRMALVVGDVMGKGVPAAIFMAQTHALLRASADINLSPAETLQRVNRLLLKMNDKGLFVTVVYGILYGPTGTFEYARAGHELPLMRSSTGEISFAPMGDGMPLGIMDEPLLDENRLTLAPGELLLLYSDGVPDGSDSAGNHFDRQGLITAVRATLNQNSQQICQSVLQAVTDFQQGAPQFDDITLLAVLRV